MKLAEVAPHLAGRMLPPIITGLMPRKARFAGDPWADQAPFSAWYWMHATGCANGLYRAMRNEEFWQRVEESDPSQLRLPDGFESFWQVAMPYTPATAAAAPEAQPAQADLFTGE